MSNEKALNAYMENYGEVVRKLEQLQQLADEHFGDNPDNIDWGHVGSITHINELLDQVLSAVGSTQDK